MLCFLLWGLHAHQTPRGDAEGEYDESAESESFIGVWSTLRRRLRNALQATRSLSTLSARRSTRASDKKVMAVVVLHGVCNLIDQSVDPYLARTSLPVWTTRLGSSYCTWFGEVTAHWEGLLVDSV